MSSEHQQTAQSRPGYIFCVTTQIHPERIHIGITSDTVAAALKQMNGGVGGRDNFGRDSVGLPDFELEWSERVDDILTVDDALEQALDAFRDENLRTYFFCAPEDAYAALEIVLGRREESEPE